MADEGLIGSRIRERRQIASIRQADLAREIGISASYLNLIEHNRRRIGGKLLHRIAAALDVESSVLSEGAEAALVDALRNAQSGGVPNEAEADRLEEFAGRFPGWAHLLADMHRRVGQLETIVERLNDRLSHDTALANSVHELLTTAASIRSTASILAETDELDPAWLNRFHTNINQDSARLAEGSRALANYLEEGKDPAGELHLPREEVDAIIAARGFFFEELETGRVKDISKVDGFDSLSRSAQAMLAPILETWQQDAQDLPMQTVTDALAGEQHPDPNRLAQELSVPVALVLRRLAALPDLKTGFVMCDRSGSLLLRKPIAGFAFPRVGASCPIWPLFQALTHPGIVVHQNVAQHGRFEAKFNCIAVAEVVGASQYNMPPLHRSSMLILPDPSPGQAAVELGASCRICTRENCEGRREPAVI